MAEALVEPWLRGPIVGLHPLAAPILHSFTQVREDLAKFTEGLSVEQIWARPHGFGSVGFHVRHIAGATGRLMTYVQGQQISEAQVAAMHAEHEPGATREELLAAVDDAFRRAEEVVRALDPAKLDEPREVGRKRFPTTVVGLLTHIAEHAQRHTGQAISAAKLARADRKLLTADVAKQIAAAAVKEADRNQWKLSIAIVDDGGNLLYLERMDDATAASAEVAPKKARCALMFRRPTKAIEDVLAGGRAAILGLPGAVPLEGGIPLAAYGTIVGAIGASGATSQQDGVAAQAGVDLFTSILSAGK
jgi:glc operon protein GlcG